MNIEEIKIITEILHYTEQNPAGYLDDFEEGDDAIDNDVYFNSLIRRRCKELLNSNGVIY
jgi:hypothetical protein